MSKPLEEQIKIIQRVLGKNKDTADEVLHIGKYKGELLSAVGIKDPDYLAWLVDKKIPVRLKDKILDLL